MKPTHIHTEADLETALAALVAADPRFVMLPLVWSTGVVVLVRKSSQDVVPET